MVVLTLAFAGALSIVTGVAFVMVGRAVHARPVSDESRLARFGAAAWWWALGAYLVLQGSVTVVAAQDALTLEMFLLSRVVANPLLCISVWGITYYLVHLFTGSKKAAIALGALYATVLGIFFISTFESGRTLRVDPWIVGLDPGGDLQRVVYVMVGLPPILSSIAYLSLLTQVTEPLQRYRIVLVAGTILGYIGSGLVAFLGTDDTLKFVVLVVFGMGAAAASLLAYYPPRFVVRWLGGGPA
ncbi:MAG: hypothetical protein HY556_09025 [Euryarchaeota archaeon]|nr:hypothetical protein [Euryarchaeota archaeon]